MKWLKGKMALKMSVLVVCVLVQFLFAHATAIGDADSLAQETEKDGNYLLTLGQTFNDPLLRLIGSTLINREKREQQNLASQQDLATQLEILKEEVGELKDEQLHIPKRLCELNPCGEWSQWTVCPVRNKQQFSMVTRNRTCRQNTSLCTYPGKQEFTKTERKVCEGFCRAEYNITGGFCLRFYDVGLIQSEAEKRCLGDGGHLVNIDTEKKSNAVHGILASHGYTGTIWLDGIRTHVGAPWEFVYGSVPDFDNWPSGEPSNGSSELCKAEVHSGARKWFDRRCTDSYKFVCEVAPEFE